MRWKIISLLAAIILFLLSSSLGLTQGTLGDGFYDDIALPLKYLNNWDTNVTDASAYGGSYHRSLTTSATFQVDFFGVGVTVWGTRSGGGAANATACLDASCVNVTFYNTSTLYKQIIIEFTGLTWGAHTLTIDNIGTSARIFIDAVQIHAPSALTPTPTGSGALTIEVTAEITVEVPPPDYRITANVDDGDGNLQNVAFDYQISAGDVAVFLAVMALFLVVLYRAVKGGGL